MRRSEGGAAPLRQLRKRPEGRQESWHKVSISGPRSPDPPMDPVHPTLDLETSEAATLPWIDLLILSNLIGN